MNVRRCGSTPTVTTGSTPALLAARFQPAGTDSPGSCPAERTTESWVVCGVLLRDLRHRSARPHGAIELVDIGLNTTWPEDDSSDVDADEDAGC